MPNIHFHCSSSGSFRAFIVGILVLMLWQVSFAQLAGQFYPETNLSDFPFTVTAYGPDNQLPQSEIKSIIKKPLSGELLFSTSNGVVVFNGYEMLPFSNEPVYSELNYLKLYYNSQYPHPLGFNDKGELFLLGLQPKIIGRFGAVDIREKQWTSIDSTGIIQFNDNTNGTKINVKTGLDHPSFLKYLDNGRFILSDAEQTYLFTLATQIKTPLIRDVVIASKTDTKTNTTYLLSHNKVYMYTQKSISEIHLTDNKNLVLRDLEIVDRKAIIISNVGIFIVSEAGVKRYSEDDVLPTNSLNSIYFDNNSGCLFIGTGNKGLLKLQKKLFENFYEKKSLFFGSFSSVVSYNDSVLFAAGAKTIVQISPGKPLVSLGIKASFSTLSVYGDTLFAGTWGDGIYLLSLKTKRVLSRIPQSGLNIHSIFRDSKGVYWVGTTIGILRGKTVFDLKEHYPKNINMRVTTIYEAKNGQLWLGGGDGIVVLGNDGNICLRFSKTKGVNAADVRSFYEDTAGKIWIGTYGGGLFCYNGEKLIALTKKPGYMLGKDVFTLARDGYGNILMTSNNGLQAVPEDAMNRFLNDEIAYLIPFRIGSQSGVLNPEFNGGFLNNYATSDRMNFYFPSVQGVVRYAVQAFRKNENKLKITEVVVDNLVVDKPYYIPRHTQFLTFGFNKVVFSEAANVYYQYELVYGGNTIKWSKPQKGTSVTFSYLKPGKYHLFIRSIDAFNDPNPSFVGCDFYIEPYYYERTDFRLGVIALLIFVAFSIIRYRYKKQKHALEKEIEVQNTISELQLKSIQAQMNPHFIFNSMNVLVQLISSQKLKKAEDFAISFSKLLRNVLEQSDKNFITIGNEIKNLQSYLDIQQIRFEGSFSYNINCPDDLLKLQIPTMLLQPIAENAILHGISHASYPCELSIDFSHKEADIYIEIRDNGIGRTLSKEINSSIAHNAIGIELIKRKINLLRAKYNIRVGMHIRDLNPDTYTGTVVLFIIKSL